MFNSSSDIENTLLSGEPLIWIDTDTKKEETLQLGDRPQRSLFKFLLTTSERDAGNLSNAFIDGIKHSYADHEDPANAIRNSAEIHNLHQSLRLEKIESHGFGGINIFEDDSFSYVISGKSICLEGENGAGKSSLVAAIQWALTGKIIKDRAEEKNLENSEVVYNNNNESIGKWPPIASYPSKLADFNKSPKVWVKLTFANGDNNEYIIAERTFENGITSVNIDPRIEKISSLFEPSILMPSRLPHIDLSGKTANLVDAIQKLTGLEPLAELGDFASGSGLGHSTRQFLKYAKIEGLESKKTQYEDSIKNAHEIFEKDEYNILQLKEDIASNKIKDNLDELERDLLDQVTDKLAVIENELPENYKVEEHTTQIRGAVNSLSNTLSAHKDTVIPCAIKLKEICSKFDTSFTNTINKKIEEVEEQVLDAIHWHNKRQEDEKLKLKLIAAQYHLKIKAEAEVLECPLCETSLKDKQALSSDLKELKEAKEEAQKGFEDRIREIRESLMSALPNFSDGKLEDYAKINPRNDFVDDLFQGIVEKESVKTILVGVGKFLTPILESASTSLPNYDKEEFKCDSEWNSYPQLAKLSEDITAIKRTISLSVWWSDNKNEYHNLWTSSIGTKNAETKKYPDDSVQGKLVNLTNALDQSKPFEIALSHVKKANKHSQEWQTIKKEQDLRESITRSLKPLSKLRKYVESQSKETLKGLSQEMANIYETICSSEKFKYQSTKIVRKDIVVQGQLHEDFGLDATLVANTSWLRAVLWSFVFALRNATIDRFGYNPFPLMVLDDPQNTFDSKHKRKWAEHICDLSKLPRDNIYTTQFFITSHDMQFVNAMMKLARFDGSIGLISYANPTTKVLVIADGIEIERNWAKADNTRSQPDGFQYVSYMRIYIETLLKIILQGEAQNISGMILSNLRDLLIDHKAKGIPPFDRSQFQELINNTENGIKEIKILQSSHHVNDGSIGYNEAKDINDWWISKFQKIILNAFDTYREYRLINGEPRSLFAGSPIVELPEGYKNVIANENIQISGKVAALTDGRHCDGCFSVEENNTSENVKLFNHSVYRVISSTLEPVVGYGDVIIVSNHEAVNSNDLVVTIIEDKIIARRYNRIEENPELVALISQSLNPNDIKPTHIAHSSSIVGSTKKIVGVLYDKKPLLNGASTNEVMTIEGESEVKRLISNSSLFEIRGRSAEPYALDGQHLLVGKPESDFSNIVKMDGNPVFAIDEEHNNYFKRIRIFKGGKIISLESLDLGGKENSMLFSSESELGLPKLLKIYQVKGVIFTLPELGRKSENYGN